MYRSLFIICLLLTGLNTGLLAQGSSYADQVSAIEEMLADGNYKIARAQSQALVESGEQAQMSQVEALGHLLLGQSLTDNPMASAKDRVAGIRQLQMAAQQFKRDKDAGQLKKVLKRLKVLTGNTEFEIKELPSAKASREKLPSTDSINEATITAIVSLQEQEIEALNESQMRQMIRLQSQRRELDEYAFKRLNDSVMLLQQEMLIEQQEAEVEQGILQRNLFFVLAGAALLFLGLLYSRFRSSRRYQAKLVDQNRLISEERQRSEELLLNILPVTVAAELKETGKASARSYDDVSVMFADFKGFSAIAATMSPEELIGHLDEAFRAFDKIVRGLGLEKIKTIGDAYMCAGGLPEETKDHAQKIVLAALEMQEYLDTNEHFSARIGIHSGPVVAGVVGQDKFVYDIWGDTVNQASRLEVAGVAGKVAVSATVAKRLGKGFTCIPAGTFEAKNIGTMERFFVERKG